MTNGISVWISAAASATKRELFGVASYTHSYPATHSHTHLRAHERTEIRGTWKRISKWFVWRLMIMENFWILGQPEGSSPPEETTINCVVLHDSPVRSIQYCNYRWVFASATKENMWWIKIKLGLLYPWDSVWSVHVEKENVKLQPVQRYIGYMANSSEKGWWQLTETRPNNSWLHNVILHGW